MKKFLFILFCISSIYAMEDETKSSTQKSAIALKSVQKKFEKAIEYAHQNSSQKAFEKIEKYLNLGANINARLSDSRKTALIEAVEHLNKPLFDFLLKHNADINAHGPWGDTPLYLIIQKKRDNRLHPNIRLFDVEKDFLQHKANPNIKDVTGDSIFMWAMQFETSNVIKLLIKHGAKINEKDRFGWTPLDWAIDRRNFEVIAELCNRGASLVDINDANSNAFHVAIQRKFPKEYINFLITNSRFDSYNEETDERLKTTIKTALLVFSKLKPTLPQEIQLIIFSHLALNCLYDSFNKKLCQVIVGNKDAKNPLLTYTFNQVNCLEQILESTNNHNKTALQILHEKYPGSEAIQEIGPLVDVKKLQQDRIAFINGSFQEDNLVTQIYKRSKKLLKS